jgi:hypothetical protein
MMTGLTVMNRTITKPCVWLFNDTVNILRMTWNVWYVMVFSLKDYRR